MNPITQRNRTLGELMTELRARCSFITQGSASKNNDTLMKSFLAEAHEFVFGELEPPAQRCRAVVQVEAGSNFYDYHDDEADEPIDPGRVLGMWLLDGAGGSQPLVQGITESDRDQPDSRARPERYDTLAGQIELRPVPDQPYQLVIDYTAERARFDRASDRPSVPDRLVFLYALANAKAHYRQPDAQAAASAFQTMLAKAKSRQKENRRYFAGAASSLGQPQVVRTANGYSLKVV